jgi:hypothetical protein
MKSNKALFLGVALLCFGGAKAESKIDSTVEKIMDICKSTLKVPLKNIRPYIMLAVGAHCSRTYIPEVRTMIADNGLVKKLESIVPGDLMKNYGGYMVDAAVAHFLYRVMRSVVAPHTPEVVRGPIEWITKDSEK